MTASTDAAEIARQLAELRLEHRDLDAAIERLSLDPQADELTVKRLKKRKLWLKDCIARLESALIPDQPA
ncbi:YdcH family protein [Lysobacter firmicutimachus]|uniref:YdcH family protein n=1 Tax=Lysobacter firmicutimachus TaxID=1792846 RepID=A0AAU8MWK3_9GAMM|nr:YdcH family protein [Lysobacter antibioticus]